MSRLFRRLAWVCLTIAGGSVLVAGCTQRTARSETGIDSDAEAYVRLVLALAERDPDSLDSYFGPPAWQAEARARRQSLGDVQRSARALLVRLDRGLTPVAPRSDAGARHDFLIRQLRALVARVDVLTGLHRPFAEESRLLFGVEPLPIDRTQTASIYQNLDRLLPGRGDLTRRLVEFQRRLIVPAARLPSVLSRAIDECRNATLRHVALPLDERVDVAYVGELPWTAFTRYEGEHRSRITVNASVALTVDDVFQLACHEAYPGHHVMNVLVDDVLVRAAHRPELMVQLLFSPQALVAEGAASIAPQVAFSDAERLRFEQSTLFVLAGLDSRDAGLALEISRLVDGLTPVRAAIAVRYVDGELEFARAADRLKRDALMPFPDAMLKFLNQYRTYVIAYARGPELAAAYLDAHAPSGDGGRWRAYAQLIASPSQAFEK